MSRKFLVLDSSGVGWNFNFDGMLLEWIRDIPELGQNLFKQPAFDADGRPACATGTIALDYSHTLELEEDYESSLNEAN